LLQHVSIVPCLCVFGISHFGLYYLYSSNIISKEELLEKLWNDKYYIDENVLLVNMTRLKKKMKEIGIVHLLENIRGKGWKL
ncbi:winged helix-turn-helix domain-containing protein, partial [Allocoprococcus comes]|uniref:winged helix-turn-helix domain-containing protein n=1 Tax=Coprococcus comes TaxID=410072 RepID=UPI001FA79614